MKTIEKDHRVYFNQSDMAYANISIHKKYIKLEMIKVLPLYRGRNLASRLLNYVIEYIKQNCKQSKIILSPMPIQNGGKDESYLDLEQLINFYKRHHFTLSRQKTQEEPYLMEYNL